MQAQQPPQLRLFCFPHAGASGTVFLDWSAHLPPGVEVVGVQLPGRGSRSGEPPLSSIGEIVAELSEAMARCADAPSVFFGHSFGAAVAYELARALRASNGPHPKGIVISSCPAPGAKPKRAFMLHDLPTEQFFLELARLEGMPAAVTCSKKLRELIEPPLRADIKCRELWALRHRAAGAPPAPLPIPLYAIGGSGDRFVSREDLEQWKPYTVELQAVALFSGGHFYFREQPAAVTASIAGFMKEIARTGS